MPKYFCDTDAWILNYCQNAVSWITLQYVSKH